MSWLIIVAIILAILFYGVMIFNRLTKLKYQVQEAWSNIDVQLKRRYNLIPNLVETVKGYAKHEASTLEAVIEARNLAMANGGSPEDKAQRENMLTGALKSLFALSEAYPDLKANVNFLQLQKDLFEIEDKIQAARRYYNGTVRDNNTYVMQFPSNIIARSFNFTVAEFFEIEDPAARQPVQVSF